MSADLATLGLRLTNAQAIADAKATGAAFEDMGVKGEAAQKKLAANSNPVTEAIKRQAVTVEQGRAAWAASGGDMSRLAQELQKVAGGASVAEGGFKALYTSGMTWTSFLKANMAPAMSVYGGHVQAMKPLGEAWAALKGSAEGAVPSIGRVSGAMGAAHLATGRLGNQFGSLITQIAGAHPIVGNLASIMGNFAIGSLLTVGILGGLALIAVAYDKLTGSSRKAIEAGDKLTETYKEQARITALGLGGKFKADIEDLTKSLEANLKWAHAFSAISSAMGGNQTGLGAFIGSLGAGHIDKALENTDAIAQARQQAVNELGLQNARDNEAFAARVKKENEDAVAAAMKLAEEQKRYNDAIAQAVAQTNKLSIEQAKKTVGLESDRANADLLLAAAKLGTAEYNDQADAIAVQNQLAQDGIYWFDARYDAAKRNLEVTTAERRETERILKARSDDASAAESAAQKAADEAQRPFKNMIRELQSDFATFFDDIFTKGIKSFGDLVSSIKAMFLKMIAELLAAGLMKKLAGGMAGMMGFPAVAGATGGGSAEGGGMLSGLGGQMARYGGAAVGAAFVGYQVGGSMYDVALSDRQNRLRGGLGGAASGAATGAMIAGPVGAAVGAIVGFTAGVLGSASAAKKAEKALLELQAAVKLSQAAYHAGAIGDTLGAAIAQAQAGLVKMLADINAAYPGSKREVERNQRRAQAQADEVLIENKIRQQDALSKQGAQGSLEVRNLRALGQGGAADSLAFQQQQQQELAQAMIDQRDATYMATLATVQNNELLAFNNKLLENLSALNTVSGYKLQATVFGAMAPGNPYAPSSGFPPVNPAGPNTGPGGLTPPGGDLTVNVVMADGTVIGKAVLKDFKGRAQKQFGESSKWAEIQ